MFAAPVWHYWIGVSVMLLVALVTVVFLIQFFRKTQAPKYGPDQ
jgi:heme/copper-type cytochrome/quinol oxidase subunit 2